MPVVSNTTSTVTNTVTGTTTALVESSPHVLFMWVSMNAGVSMASHDFDNRAAAMAAGVALSKEISLKLGPGSVNYSVVPKGQS